MIKSENKVPTAQEKKKQIFPLRYDSRDSDTVNYNKKQGCLSEEHIDTQ